MEALGNKCAGCGFEDYRALQIDHVNGGGKRLRRLFGSQLWLYKDVLQNPSRYQLLCANCNSIKGFEQGEFFTRLNKGDKWPIIHTT